MNQITDFCNPLEIKQLALSNLTTTISKSIVKIGSRYLSKHLIINELACDSYDYVSFTSPFTLQLLEKNAKRKPLIIKELR